MHGRVSSNAWVNLEAMARLGLVFGWNLSGAIESLSGVKSSFFESLGSECTVSLPGQGLPLSSPRMYFSFLLDACSTSVLEWLTYCEYTLGQCFKRTLNTKF